MQNGVRWHEISARNCQDAQTGEATYILSEVDVTEFKEQQRRISFMAHHDMLTVCIAAIMSITSFRAFWASVSSRISDGHVVARPGQFQDYQ